MDYVSSKCNRLEAQSLLRPRFKAQLTPGVCLPTRTVTVTFAHSPQSVCAMAEDAALHDGLLKFMKELPPIAVESPAFVRPCVALLSSLVQGECVFVCRRTCEGCWIPSGAVTHKS